MMKIIQPALLLVTCIVFSGVASANMCTQEFNTVGFVGLDTTQGGLYVDVSEGNSGECQCGYFRFDSANTNTEMALSVLLSAKAMGKKVRVDLSTPGNCNSGIRVYIR